MYLVVQVDRRSGGHFCWVQQSGDEGLKARKVNTGQSIEHTVGPMDKVQLAGQFDKGYCGLLPKNIK